MLHICNGNPSHMPFVASRIRDTLTQDIPVVGDTYRPRVVGNLRWPPKTCHSSSESWENGDSEYVIRYAGKIRPFLKFQCLYNIRNYFLWPLLRRLPSQQTPNIWYALVANMLESNPAVRNISEIHLRLHKLRCIPILTLHIQHGSHSPPPAASL